VGRWLPIFRGDEDDYHAQHLIYFHEYMIRLGILHEDVLMKMSMYYLEGDAQQWYMYLPPSSISSLKYFHVVFHAYCKRIYHVEILLEHCCEHMAFEISPSNRVHEDLVMNLMKKFPKLAMLEIHATAARMCLIILMLKMI